jgi:hypothetical protein
MDKIEAPIHSLLGQQDRMSRHTPLIVREKFDELLLEIDELHREIAKTLEEDVASLQLNDAQHHEEMLQFSIQRVRLMLKHAMALTVSYRNLIVDTVEIGVNVARR